MIEINGESITKSAFQARNMKAVEEAAKRLPELRARARAQSDARRKALLDKRAAELAKANKKSRSRDCQTGRRRRRQAWTQLGSAQETSGRTPRAGREGVANRAFRA